MGKKHVPGLQKIGKIWHIEKRVNGSRICESTGTGNLEEAERYLIRKLEAIRQATVYGIRPKRLFREAAIKFLREHQHKRSIKDDADRLKMLDKFIGDLALELVHMGSLQTYIEARRKEGVKTRTINHGLKVVRRILNLAADEWMDEYGLTWLKSTPKIKLLPEHDLRKPYPINWEEQEQLFAALPKHLRAMALFAVNTGSRDREICRLRWDWEFKLPEIGSIFIIPGELVKNGEDRLIVLNHLAHEVIENQRGKNAEFVFVYKNKPIKHMLNTGWRLARKKVNLPQVRVHDLKHTFGRRLRAAGVSYEDRQDLLGHKSARITTHYSAAEISNLIKAADKVCERRNNKSFTQLRLMNNLGRGHEKLTNTNFLRLVKVN